jgi:hypothetical protein
MDSYQLNYDFKIEPENAGYFTITSDEGDITMLAKFVVDGEIHENLFELKHDGLNVTAYKTGNNEWQSMQDCDTNRYPSSAYPLLLPRVEQRLVYISIDEGTGEIAGETMLERTGDVITETRRGQLIRQFKMKDEIPIEINWGGPISTLHETFTAAKQGSPFE